MGSARSRSAAFAAALTASLVGVACGPSPNPPDYTVTEIEGLGGTTQPLDIDDAGLVVGASLPAGADAWPGEAHPFAWTADGGARDLAPSTTLGGVARRIDADGTILGETTVMPDADGQTDQVLLWPSGGGAPTVVSDDRAHTPVDVADGTVLLDWSPFILSVWHVWRDGTTTEGPSASQVGGNVLGHDVNDAGLVVGETARYGQQAVTWDSPASDDAVLLPGLGGTWSQAVAVNDAGRIAGNAQNAAGQGRAVVWEDGAVTDLGSLGSGVSTVAVSARFDTAPDTPGEPSHRALNASGQVVGTSPVADGRRHAFLWTEGTMRDLGTLGGSTSEAVAVNDAGVVVGTSQTASGGTHAFVWEDGVMTDLTALAPGITTVVDVNDAGQVLGWSPTTGEAVVWTPAD